MFRSAISALGASASVSAAAAAAAAGCGLRLKKDIGESGNVEKWNLEILEIYEFDFSLTDLDISKFPHFQISTFPDFHIPPSFRPERLHGSDPHGAPGGHVAGGQGDACEQGRRGGKRRGIG